MAERLLEKELTAMTAQVEQLLAENEGLRRACAEAEATNSAKDRFLADVAHETRTPLGAILGLIALVRNEALSPEASRYLGVAESSGQALLRILDELLDLSKVRAGQFGLEEVVFDLRPMVQDAVETLALEARVKGLDLKCSFGLSVPPSVGGDPGRIRQVLLNLIRNAIHCTQAGEVAVHVEADSEIPSGGTEPFLHFSVSDTGKGIPAAELGRLFRDYQQLGPSGSGTGLGLSISKRLARAMGGDLSVSSSLNKGSSFVASIPLKTAAEERPPEVSPGSRRPLAFPEEERAPTRPLRVLVAEDDAATALAVAAILKVQGVEGHMVSTGWEAVAAFRPGIFDLVLMDLHMPAMDGEAGTRAIRGLEAEQGGRVPILGFTAHATPGEKSRCVAAGIDGFLGKPFSAEELRTEIQRVARAASLGKAAARQTSPGATLRDDLRRRHFSTFWENCLVKRDEMREAIAADDVGRLRCAAHALRGSAAVFGLSDISALAGDIEEIGHKGTLVAVDEVFRRFEQALEAVALRRQI